MMRRRTVYGIMVVALSLVYYGALVLVKITTESEFAQGAALLCSSATICLLTIYICDKKGLRADIAMLCTLVAYWAILLPLAYFTPENWRYLSINSMVYWQGLPTLVIAFVWYAYQMVLSSLDKDG